MDFRKICKIRRKKQHLFLQSEIYFKPTAVPMNQTVGKKLQIKTWTNSYFYAFYLCFLHIFLQNAILHQIQFTTNIQKSK